MPQSKKLKRTIFFYELEFSFVDSFTATNEYPIESLFNTISSLVRTKASIRYQNYGEKSIFMQDVKHQNDTKKITGKLRAIRKDMLPELMNTNTDISREIDAKEDEGLVETTHFVINLASSKTVMAIEYNQFGAKIQDFTNYTQTLGINKGILKQVKFIPIVSDTLDKLKDRINRCSELNVRVERNNIPKIKTLDENLYSALKAAQDHFKNDYVTLILKFNYKSRPTTSTVNNTIFNLVKKFKKNKEKTDLFDHLIIKAEDSERNNKLEVFDLLMNKVKSDIHVERKIRSRVIISNDILIKMSNELSMKIT